MLLSMSSISKHLYVGLFHFKYDYKGQHQLPTFFILQSSVTCLEYNVVLTSKVHEKILSTLLYINTAGLKLNLAKCHLRSSFLHRIIFQIDLRYEPFCSAVVIKNLPSLVLTHITLCYQYLLRTTVPL